MTVAGKEIGKGMFEPGRRWSTHVKPIAGTESCEFSHFMYVSSERSARRFVACRCHLRPK